MKMKKYLSVLLSIILFSFISLNISPSSVSGTEGDTITLNAEANNSGNYVSLNWTPSNTSEKYSYTIHSKRGDETDFQSIPAKANVKVLNIYPDTGNNLKGWMENPNAEDPNGYGRGLISVDPVSITEFNKDPKKYLKDNNDTWIYDVIMLGSWDANNSLVPSNDAVNLFAQFIDSGRGFLAGHDTIGFELGTNRGLGIIRDKFNIKVGYWSDNQTPTDEGYNYYAGFIGDRVKVNRKGLLTNYPWNIGEIGTTLSVPISHSTSNFALGDIWMTYSENTKISESNIPTSLYDQSNFYLTTWNNTAMIQTGHSNGAATPDEQKVLANTLFYLSQVTEDTNWDDHKGQDLAAPDKPNITNVTRNANENKISISLEPAKDNGSSYEYYVEGVARSNGDTIKSDTKSTTVTTGVKGYSIIVDDKEDTKADGTTTTTDTNYTLDKVFDGDFYVHVATVDNAGNVSETTTYKYTLPSLKLTPSTTEEVKDKVTIKAEASGSREIAKIITPDGKEVSGNTAEFDVDANGTYTFKAIDTDGNEITESIKIDNIIPDVILDVEPNMNKVHLAENVVVDLTMDNIKNIGGTDVRIKYDDSKLEFLGFDEVVGIKFFKQKAENGEMRLTLFSDGLDNFVNDKKTLLKLNFKPIAAGDALIDITKGRISDGITLEKDLRAAECGETTINIVNRKLKDKFTLLDVTMVSRHIGEDPEKLLPDMDLDLNLDGKIDQADVDKAYALMMANKDYDF